MSWPRNSIFHLDLTVSMAINRRQFLGLSAGTFFLGNTQWLQADGTTRLLSCRTDKNGQHYVTLFNLHGGKLLDIRLPARGHGIAVNPQQNLAAVFARRPGEYLWIIDIQSGQVIEKISAAQNRHFYGHGVFTPDRKYLLCSENAFDSGDGRIGIYDAANHYQRVGELPGHGIGPHEIRLLNDGKTLVIANGGIQTHPDLPRVKSNLKTMRPNLAYLDIQTGKLAGMFEPPEKWHQLSIRHIDVASDDTVAIAMQFQGKLTERPALVATHNIHTGNGLKLHSAPVKVQRKMKNYCGSVAFSKDSSQFAISSPRGNLVTYWSRSGTYLGKHQQADACGVTASGNSFLVSDGTGSLNSIDNTKDNAALFTMNQTRWDNHLVSI